MLPADRAVFDACAAAVRAALGDATFEAERAAGYALAPDAAAALLLGRTPAGGATPRAPGRADRADDPALSHSA